MCDCDLDKFSSSLKTNTKNLKKQLVVDGGEEEEEERCAKFVKYNLILYI